MRAKHPVFALVAAMGFLGLAVPFVQADSGSSSATMTLVVPVQTVVSCSSPSVTAAPGANNLTVTCTISGNPNSLTSGTANAFGPGSVSLSDGGSNTLTASLQSAVTSPDGTITSISGTSSGFSGSIKSLPAKVQAAYSVNTTASTKSGTYTGNTTYTWSTL
jgi:hypothetical protein